jgi:septal ring factor EnvC (AmiA/AmiB activator)
VFRSRFSPKAETNPRAHRLAIVGTVLVSALVTSTSVTVVFVPRPSGADQVSDLKARAAAVSQQLIQQQLQVGAYQQQYSVASAKVAADAGAIAQVDQQIAQDQRQIDLRMGDVRQQAIQSYMSYGTGSSGSAASLFSGDEDKVQATSEYTGIATGNITTTVDQLNTAQQALRSDQSVLQAQQAQDLSDQNSQAVDLGRATGTQQQMEQLQAQVTGQLATAVAQQAAAQAAAAAAAVRAAQASAAAASAALSARSHDSAPAVAAASAAPASGGTDPALNPFLQCVVQVESGGNYGAVSPNGLYMGAFQFSQATWNVAAQAAGRPDLVGVPPNRASKADQDTVAVALYALDGEQPWLGDRCSS